MTPDEKFLAALRDTRAGERRRVSLDKVMSAFLAIWPEMRSSVERRAALLRRLEALAQAGHFELPRTAIDDAVSPPLPRWISFPAPIQADANGVNHKIYPWALPMSFIASWPRLPDPDVAIALNDFFRNGGSARPLVPIKERSYSIFGHEKKLEAVLATRYGQQLSLDALRCFIVQPVPVHYSCASAASIHVAVVENEASFDSLARWNREHQFFAKVIYGRGDEILKCTSFLCECLSPGGEIYYWGDLDERGLSIPAQIQASLETQHAQKSLVALRGVYNAMLPAAGDLVPSLDQPVPPAMRWMPDDLARRVSALLASGRRVSQEAVGWEWLERVGPQQVLDRESDLG